MSETKSSTSNGISLAALLTILFIGLKLTNNINWDWLWVLSPLWVPAVMIVVALGLVFAGAGIYLFFRWCFRKIFNT